MTEDDVKNIIKSDPWMMSVLRAARSQHLPDWMIGAGFVRNKIWDHLHGFSREVVDTPDIDLIYFDPNDISEETEKKIDAQLRTRLNVAWSTKNQARMHTKHERAEPYRSSVEGLAEWVETPTCVAVRLEDDDTLSIFAPHGINDLVNLVVRPSPTSRGNLPLFWERVKSKQWEKKWPKLTVLES